MLPDPSPVPDVSPAGLTEREVDVLRLIARGLSNAEIAAALVVSEATVRTHVNHLFAKTVSVIGPRRWPVRIIWDSRDSSSSTVDGSTVDKCRSNRRRRPPSEARVEVIVTGAGPSGSVIKSGAIISVKIDVGLS